MMENYILAASKNEPNKFDVTVRLNNTNSKTFIMLLLSSHGGQLDISEAPLDSFFVTLQ